MSCCGLAVKETVAPTEDSFSHISMQRLDISVETGASSSSFQIAILKSLRDVFSHSCRFSLHPLASLSVGPAIIFNAISKSLALLASGPHTERSGSGTLGINSWPEEGTIP